MLNGLLKDSTLEETVKVKLVDNSIDRTVEQILQKDVEISNSNDSLPAQDKPKTVYRVDAEEFVPRAYREPPRLPLLNMTNFVPMPVPQFLPPPIPINLFPGHPDPKIIPNFINFIPNQPHVVAPMENGALLERAAPTENAKPDIDIAKIVSKLEEAALEQNTAKPAPSNVPNGVTRNRYDNNKFKSRSYDRNHRKPEAKSYAKPSEACVCAKVQVQAQKPVVNVPRATPPVSSPVKSVPDYSETVKRNKSATSKYDKPFHSTGKPNWKQLSSPKSEALEDVPRVPDTVSRNPKPVDRWISVQSRKKRKNGKVENDENDSELVMEEESNKEFEEYDVSLLVDVVVPKKDETEAKSVVFPVDVQNSVEKLENFVGETENFDEKVQNNVNQVQTPLSLETDLSSNENEVQNSTETIVVVVEEKSVVVPTLKTLASTSLKDAECEQSVCVAVTNDAALETKTVEDAVSSSPALETIEDSKNKLQTVKGSHKKKQKKGVAAKPPQKRIMITDIDLSAPVEVKPEVKPVEKQPERIEKVEKVEKLVPAVIEDVKPTEKTAEVVDKKEAVTSESIEAKPEEVKTPDKKPKKKKKKSKSAAKEAAQQSLSSSLLTLNGTEDTSCDFLDKTCEEIDSKTNVEVSQEIDRMIQRGLYANLEEKMKSLNLEHSPLDDTFFKSVANDVAAFNLLKSPKETKINGSLLGSVAPQINGNLNGLYNSKKINLDLKKIAAQPEKVSVAKKNQKTAKTIAKEVGLLQTSEEDNKLGAKTAESLVTYPITQAVKEWMSKTRENTPELEILKSPSEIKQEFCINEGDDSESDAGAKEDIVVFSAEVDLLECWENEISAETTPTSDASEEALDVALRNGDTAAGKIEEGEDVLEVYESVYGKNDDYLKLKAEVEKETAQRARFAKHGDLPYRAICCSVM